MDLTLLYEKKASLLIIHVSGVWEEWVLEAAPLRKLWQSGTSSCQEKQGPYWAIWGSIKKSKDITLKRAPYGLKAMSLGWCKLSNYYEVMWRQAATKKYKLEAKMSNYKTIHQGSRWTTNRFMIVALKSNSLVNHLSNGYKNKRQRVEYSFGILKELEAEILCRDTLASHRLCLHLCHINMDLPKLGLEEESKFNVYKYGLKHKHIDLSLLILPER